MKLPRPSAPFELLEIRGESITVDTTGTIIVLPTGYPDVLPDFNEYVIGRNPLAAGTYAFTDDPDVDTGLQNLNCPWIAVVDSPRLDILPDSSANNLDGAMTNVSLAYDNISNPYGAIKFNGEGSYINCGNDSAFNFTSAMTLVCSLKVLSTPTSYPRIISKELATGGDSFGIYVRGDRLGMTTHAIVDVAASAAGSIGANWVRVVFTFDKPDAMFYIDGSRSGAAGTYNADLATTAYNLIIGNNSANTRYSDMLLKDVRLYNRAWSPAEVTADAAGQPVSLTGLVGQWDPYQPSNEIDFFVSTERFKNLSFERGDSGNELTLYPGNGKIYRGRIVYSDLTRDSNSSGIPDFLDPSISGSITHFLQSDDFSTLLVTTLEGDFITTLEGETWEVN